MKKIYLLGIVAAMFITAIFINSNLANANPSRRASLVSCSTQGPSATTLSTTSISYMTIGAATTTLTCNTSLNRIGVDGLNGAVMALQVTASSTGLTNFRFEYSEDGIDWYSDNLYSFGGVDTGLSTTTDTNVIWDSNHHTHSIKFASSTNACNDDTIPNNNRNCYMIPVPTPTKWVRAVFSIPSGTTNSGVWAQIIGTGETIN